MPQIRFLNKRSKLIATLQWNDPKDILSWIKKIIADNGSEFRNVESDKPIILKSIEGDAAQEKISLTKEQAIDIELGVTSLRPVLDWKKISSDTFWGNRKTITSDDRILSLENYCEKIEIDNALPGSNLNLKVTSNFFNDFNKYKIRRQRFAAWRSLRWLVGRELR